MIQLIILLAMLVRYEQNKYVPPASEYVSPKEELTQPIHVTWYVNPNGNRTASGGTTHIGSCASNKEHMGDIAILYSLEGYYIGTYEVNDTGSAQWLKDGTCIDIYVENLEQMYRMAEEFGTEYYIQWVKADG